MKNKHLRGFTDTMGDRNRREKGEWIEIGSIDLNRDEMDLRSLSMWCKEMESSGATKLRKDDSRRSPEYASFEIRAYRFKTGAEIREDQINSLEAALGKLKMERQLERDKK